jgi:hypothetical protein
LLRAGCQWLTPVILTTWEAKIKKIKVRGQPGQIVHKTPSPKVTRAKWTGDLAQVVEHLLCKHKALSLNTKPTKKKKKKKGLRV